MELMRYSTDSSDRQFDSNIVFLHEVDFKHLPVIQAWIPIKLKILKNPKQGVIL